MTRTESIVDYLARHGCGTYPQIRKALNLNRGNFGRLMNDAIKAGLVRRTGTRRNYIYWPVDQSRPPVNAPNSAFDMARVIALL